MDLKIGSKIPRDIDPSLLGHPSGARWRQDGPKMAQDAQDGPRCPQDALRWSQDAPRYPQDAPRWPQDGSNKSQVELKMVSRCPQNTHHMVPMAIFLCASGAKRPREVPKMFQDAPQMGSMLTFKNLSTGLIEALTRPLTGLPDDASHCLMADGSCPGFPIE